MFTSENFRVGVQYSEWWLTTIRTPFPGDSMPSAGVHRHCMLPNTHKIKICKTKKDLAGLWWCTPLMPGLVLLVWNIMGGLGLDIKQWCFRTPAIGVAPCQLGDLTTSLWIQKSDPSAPSIKGCVCVCDRRNKENQEGFWEELAIQKWLKLVKRWRCQVLSTFIGPSGSGQTKTETCVLNATKPNRHFNRRVPRKICFPLKTGGSGAPESVR